MEKILTFDGRIRRMGWWIAIIAVAIVSGIVERAFDGNDRSTVVSIIGGIVALIFWLIGLSINVRRWHDLDKSGWWVLINLIPIIGWIYSIVQLGFMPGDKGHNAYGAPPQEGAIL